MLTKELFKQYIENYKVFTSGIEKLEEVTSSSIWETKWVEAVGKMFDLFFEPFFTEFGLDLISSYIFEEWRGEIFKKDSEEVIANIQTLDDLWDYMIKHKEEYFLD